MRTLSRLMLIAWTTVVLAGGVAAGPRTAVPPGHRQATAQTVPVDINSASRERLRSLPGISDAAAERIVAGRPYLSKAMLVTGGVVPAGVYQQLRHRIIAIQTPSPRHAPAAGSASVGR